MSRPVIPTCDQCGKLKGPSNRWYVAIERKESFELQTSEAAGDLPALSIDLCGEECAQKRMAQWMKRQQA